MKKKLLLLITALTTLMVFSVSTNSNNYFKESATDELLLNETGVKLNGKKKYAQSKTDNVQNVSTKLASKMGVQTGTNSKGDICMRFVIAIPHLNVNVTFHRTLVRENGAETSKSIEATTAYTAISVNDSLIRLDSSEKDVFNTTLEDGSKTDYRYFVCYTMAGFTEDFATLSVQAQVTDLSQENLGTVTSFNAANIAGLTSLLDLSETPSQKITHEGILYTLSSDGTYYSAETEASTSSSATYKEKYTVLPYIVSGLGLVANKKIPVTTIANRGFAGPYNNVNKVTKEIILPDTITRIGNQAFTNMSALTSLKLPDSVEIIGDAAFENAANAFEGSVYLPKNLVSIGSRGLAYLTKVTEFCFFDKLTTISGHAFMGCSSLKKLLLPDSVKNMSGRIVWNCFNLKEVKLPKNEYYTSIDEGMFYNCGLEEITIPNTIKVIGDNMFRATDNDVTGRTNQLKKVIFEEGSQIITFKGNVFRGQDKLTEIVLPDTVETIGNIFGMCSNLTSFRLPASLNVFSDVIKKGEIFYNPLRKCSSLTEIVIPNENTNFKLQEMALYNSDMTQLYAHVHGDNATIFTIKSSVQAIAGQAFSGSNNLDEFIYEGTLEELKVLLSNSSTNWNEGITGKIITCTDGTYTIQ